MSHWLHRLGIGAAHRRRTVLVLWLVAILGIVGLDRVVGAEEVDDLSVPGVESASAVDLLEERFPERAGATATVVFHVDHGVVADRAPAVRDTIEEIRAMPSVLSVTDPMENPMSVSADGQTAFAAVQFDAPVADLGHDVLDELEETAGPAELGGVRVELGGELPTVLKERSTGPAEAIGIVAALVILLVAFRSLFAMALPLVTAIAGLLVGLSAIGLLAGVVDIPSVAPKLGTMIGLGVGIDYALFVLSRHRDNLAAGMPVAESIGRTNATAGQAVVFAGGTVVVAISGLQLAGIPFVAALGWSSALIVAVAVLVAITLMPALLAVAGARLAPRAPQVARDGRAGGWVRWAHWVAHRPWPSAIGATLVLLVLAAPVVDMRLGQADAGTDPTSATHRRAYDLLADGFGDGFNGPLLVVVDLSGADDADTVLASMTESFASLEGVEAVSPPARNAAGDTAVLTIIPTTKPQDRATTDLVHELRDATIPDAVEGTDVAAYVGGPTAAFIDQSDKISERLPLFIVTVVVLSFVLLTMVFRSVLVPLKAALLNLLSIGAAYGVVVAVFQWGWGRTLIGLDEAVPIASFVPMMMFAILFGLSMDYEVFILSRIREEHLRGRSNIDSVVEGLGATAKVITAAALIMISVFLGFVANDDPVVKMMGIGLATAVAVDATIVRMILVPATMALVGEPNWWLPRWLDRVLPRIDVEGGDEPVVGAGGPEAPVVPEVEARTREPV